MLPIKWSQITDFNAFSDRRLYIVIQCYYKDEVVVEVSQYDERLKIGPTRMMFVYMCDGDLSVACLAREMPKFIHINP